MNKKLKIGLGIGIPAVLLIAAALILFLPGGVLNNPGAADPEQPAITLSAYNTLAKDMTYEQVVEILGCEGILMESDEDNSELATYLWYGKTDGARAVITFNNNLLAARTYIGLTD